MSRKARADVSPLDFTPIWQRSLVIDFGRIYSTDTVVIISRAPRALIRPLLLLQIFTPFVWSSLLVVAMAAGIALRRLMIARQAVQKETSQGMFSYCLATFSIFVYQSSTVWPSWLGGRLVGGSLMLAAVVVGSLYSGSITAFLTIPSKSSPINSLEEMLERNIVPAIRMLSSPYSFFLVGITCHF
ncbi:hypothetical protein O3P69_011063 [Scylla paramamosain]|uniref:Ionotropic glutamate receptor C-terminal domain-containing protein n=1 Tax=Scylla paramamosain TaxID=85552 RepID=A0AAW0SSN4_SCYPA